MKNLKNVLDGCDDKSEAKKDDSQTSSLPTSSNQPQTLEQRVIHELMTGANANDSANEVNNEIISLPSSVTVTEGKQSSAKDYEEIPIAQFGLAMLRGMGLKDEEIISKEFKEPELRPKGMGLGADKMVKKNKLLVEPAPNEELKIKKNAFVRILAGKFKDLYGQVSIIQY